MLFSGLCQKNEVFLIAACEFWLVYYSRAPAIYL